MIDTGEMDRVITKLETLDDEELAVQLFKELNDRTRALSDLVMNRDESLEHEVQKQKCDEAKEKVDELLEKIDRL